MKKRNVCKAVLLTAIFAAGAMTCFAEEETEMTTEAVVEAVETEKAEDVTFTVAQGEETVEVFVENYAGTAVTAEAEAGETEEDGCTLTLTAEDGAAHVFEALDFADMSDLSLTTADTFLFIHYTNAAGESKTAYETAEEIVLDEAETYYVLSDVYMRVEANKDAKALAVLKLGDPVTVTAAMPKWCKAQLEDGTEGYVARAYLSTSKEAADAAVNVENTVRAQQAAAAAAAARAAASAQQSQGKYEVSRENFDDCDGSGHGYAIITYSDGSTATVNY